MTTPTPSPDLLSLTHRYLEALERWDQPTLEDLLHADVVQHEFPNRLSPSGVVRDRTSMLEGFNRGRAVLTSQRFAVQSAIVQGEAIAVEVVWTGTLAVPLGSLAPGETMRARFAIFLEARDGKITNQRNYDCFDPF